MMVFRFACGKIPMAHRVGDSVSLHHPTPSGFAPTTPGQWGHFYTCDALTFFQYIFQEYVIFDGNDQLIEAELNFKFELNEIL
jgi:hypothetical protein